MYGVILAPTDGSEETNAALEEAVALAELTEGTVHGLYIFDDTQYEAMVSESDILTIEDKLAEHAEQARNMIESCTQSTDVPVETPTARGIPHQEILSYADEHDADLIVMGTHARTGFNHFLHGSVTEKVIRNTTIPVLVLRIGTQEEKAG